MCAGQTLNAKLPRMTCILQDIRFPKAVAVEFFTPLHSEAAGSLALALIASSQAPLLLLDGHLVVVSASRTFCEAYTIDPNTIAGQKLVDLGNGEWATPQLQALLRATIAGTATIAAYEMDLVTTGQKMPRRLVLNAHKLDYSDADNDRIVLTVVDVTHARIAERLKDDLVREKQILLQELQHRVANSLQIIASVLMQSARKVQSEESRVHLHNAHHRVMSIATLQKQLAASVEGEVELRTYFVDLCASIGASMINDPDQLTLSARVDDSVIGSDVSVSLGLIVTELVINALKHAFPGRTGADAITVGYASKDSAWSLTVEDNGVGMPTGVKAAKHGLGTGIVEALSGQLDATVTITDAGPGTKVAIVHQ